jgi:uncharacterized membrane protein
MEGTMPELLLVLHLLGAVVWVGGMAFALLVLRPSLQVLEPPQRMALHGQVFARFFRMIWHVMPLMLLTGYAMLFGVYGGFAGVGWPVHVMHLGGLVMSGIFLVIWFGPWRALRAALQGGQLAEAAAGADRIRRLVLANLVLGVLVVAVAALV